MIRAVIDIRPITGVHDGINFVFVVSCSVVVVVVSCSVVVVVVSGLLILINHISLSLALKTSEYPATTYPLSAVWITEKALGCSYQEAFIPPKV
jgi:hypothetical protein